MNRSWVLALCALAALAAAVVAQTPAPAGDQPSVPTATAPTGTRSSTSPGECPMGMGGGMGMHGQKSMHGMGPGPGGGAMHRGMRNGQGHGMGAGMSGDMSDHANIHSLMADHASIERKVTDLPDGVRTETTSRDAKVAATIRTHVRQMYARLEKGEAIRMFDPLFREVFANASKIEMKIEDIDGGVRVTETSKDANVVLLIRAHARALDRFVAEGLAKMHEPNPLPEGYRPAK